MTSLLMFLASPFFACVGPAPLTVGDSPPAANDDSGPIDTPTETTDSERIETIGDSDPSTTESDPPETPLGDPTLVCTATLTCPSGIVNDYKQPCDLTLVSGDGAPVFDAMAMVEIRGRSSSGFVKPPYSIELHDTVSYLVPPQSTWAFLDTAAPPADGWQEPGFDDTNWSRGAAPLGYGDTVNTTIQSGPEDEHAPAAFFRTTFTLDDPSLIAGLDLDLVADDGAIVWLNGTEVIRHHLSSSAGSADWASSTVSDEYEDDWNSFYLPLNLLQAGTNTLAVEVHQASASSSDLRFDLSLLGTTGRLDPDLFGMGGEDDWILQSAYIDRVLWRNKLAYDLFQSFGGPERWAAEQVYCELTLDGDYRGVYLLGESPRRDDDRLDLVVNEGRGDSFIIKLDEESGFHDSRVSYGEWQAIYPRRSAETEGAITEISDLLTAWEDQVLAGSEAQWDYMDLDSAVDWIITEELFKNNDAYFLSIYLWRDGTGKMHFIPWDFDLTLGYPYYDCGAEGFVGRTTFVDAFAGSPMFKERLQTRWAELRAGPLADEIILSNVDYYELILGDAITRNFERWPVDEIVFSWGDVENWLCPASSWEEEHDRVLAWIPARTAWLDANIHTF